MATRTRKAQPKVDPNQTFKVYVSGNAYENGVSDRFKVKPVKRSNTGLGYRMLYDLKTADLRSLADIMAELACDISDVAEGGDQDSRVLSIYRDLSRFPKEAGL